LGDQYYHEFRARDQFFRQVFSALAFNGITGDYVEFGCCGGVTFGLAFKHSRRSGLNCHLWAFDSFRGLPVHESEADWHPVWIQGDMAIELAEFKQVCAERGLSDPDYSVVPGYYADTLLEPSDRPMPQDISLAYIDCDLYTSTKQVLQFLAPRLKHGMVLAFDDYHCWSSTQAAGERRASAEFFAQNNDWRLVPFLGIGWGGMSFLVERRSFALPGGASY
jgi:hypothetical protein